MKDKYDEAIDYLTERPEQIHRAWTSPKTHAAGCLFAFVGKPSGGCLTMVHSDPSHFTGGEWHDEIVADDRIPNGNIRVEDLPVFAEWQRRIHEAGVS